MAKAFVVGNVTIDETLSVADFPQPGASIFGTALSRDLGGKGANQAIALARTGVPCRLFSAIGRDARGAEITRKLQDEPLELALVTQDGVASDFSIIFMSEQGENAVITTTEAAASLTPDDAEAALDGAMAGDFLILQGNLNGAATESLLQMARSRGLRTAMNPSPLQPYFDRLWPLVDIVFVNEGEAEALGGVDALLAAGVDQVILTLGARGALLADISGQESVPACACDVIDTTGAGDSFMAVALASAIRRAGRLDAIALAHGTKAAAHTVAHAGTLSAFPKPSQMKAILSS